MKAETAPASNNNLTLPKVFGIIIIFLFLFVASTAYWVKVQLEPVDPHAGDVTVVISANSTTADIAELLYKEGIIRNSYFFRVYARISRLDRDLKAGNYVLSPAHSLPEIVDKLSKGSVTLRSFTIPEGYTVKQIAERLAEEGFINKGRFLDLAENGEFDFPYSESLSEGENRLEGFLFPDTYKIPDYYTEEQIIQLMLDRFTEVYNNSIKKKAEDMGMSVKETVTLASIIEREVQDPSEREIVSGVFHNRLKIEMPLQSCATVQYILGETKEVLLNEDIEKPSPYNTYLHPGLPPGPIASPGKASLLAAVSPADVEYLYFVSKGDGTHHFSTTLKEHNAAKKKYLK
ncbi:MAG: aminodeoxychorismate lyase [Clostridiales bacterium]|jgi:UPF0755 protein|nr:aminodeoxychorismate lyase [Clostridiales bacterium]